MSSPPTAGKFGPSSMRRFFGALLLFAGVLEESPSLRIFDWFARFSFGKSVIGEWSLMNHGASPSVISLALIAIGMVLIVPRNWWTDARGGKPIALMGITAIVLILIVISAWHFWLPLKQLITSNAPCPTDTGAYLDGVQSYKNNGAGVVIENTPRPCITNLDTHDNKGGGLIIKDAQKAK